MNIKPIAVICIALLAGCIDGKSGPPSAVDIIDEAPIDPANETHVWSTTVNVTTRGATEIAGYYSHSGVPSRPGLIEATDPNCVQLVVRGARLLNLTAVATWTAAGPEENLLLYHYLKESDGPFRGAESNRGTSPLEHFSDFEGRITSTEWLTIGVHPASGLPFWRGAVDTVQIDVTVNYLGEKPPVVEDLQKCAPQDKQIV